VHTIFTAGTPSLFSPEAIDRLLSGIRARCRSIRMLR
jgi:coproporphyrinogen III oxidase-like Fe-S oxidoreductase